MAALHGPAASARAGMRVSPAGSCHTAWCCRENPDSRRYDGCHACVCSFRLGRQEDAHEYLVSLLDAMHEAILAGIQPKPPREVAQTSLIYRIFGGTCRSQASIACPSACCCTQGPACCGCLCGLQ